MYGIPDDDERSKHVIVKLHIDIRHLLGYSKIVKSAFVRRDVENRDRS